METNANFYPSANAHPNERVELELSNSACIAFVCASAFLCLLLVLAYCHCYCSETGTEEVCRVFRKRKPTSPLPLPVVFYSKAAEQLTRGCVVCLSEFDDKEALKVIPACGHVFHPQCIDRWLIARRSCPVCRCSKIFGSGDNQESETEEVEVEQGAAGMRSEAQVIEMERSRSWCYIVDDHGEEERMGMRRTCSF